MSDTFDLLCDLVADALWSGECPWCGSERKHYDGCKWIEARLHIQADPHSALAETENPDYWSKFL